MPMSRITTSGFNSAQMMREALSAGARGYVVKSDAARDLLAAVEAVSQHRFFLSASLGRSAILNERTVRLYCSPGREQKYLCC